KALVLLQDRRGADHIVPPALVLKPRDLQPLDVLPADLSRTPIMTIVCEVVGLPTATMATLPVNLAGLFTHPPWTAFLSPQLGLLFFFTKLGKPRPDRPDRSLLQVLLYFLDNLLALLPFQFPRQQLSTHRPECSLLEM